VPACAVKLALANRHTAPRPSAPPSLSSPAQAAPSRKTTMRGHVAAPQRAIL